MGRGLPQAKEDQERVRERPVGRRRGQDRRYLHHGVPCPVAPRLRARGPAADARRCRVCPGGEPQSVSRPGERNGGCGGEGGDELQRLQDRKSTRLNSSHSQISYAVFCLKKKNKT